MYHSPGLFPWSLVRQNSLPVLILVTMVVANGVARPASGLPQNDSANQEVGESKTETAEGAAKPPRPSIYDSNANAQEQIDKALAKARKQHRRVLIQWGGDWCHWCHLLHDCFRTNGEVRRKLLYEYDVVLVDVGHGDKNLDLAEKYGADFASGGFPYLTILDGDGKVVCNQETGSLERKEEGVQAHDPGLLVQFLTGHQATPPSAEDEFNRGIDRAKAEGKLVFLHFGAPWCGWCHRLEDWMASSENSELLERAFVDVKIDVERMAGGEELKERYCEEEGSGIPWFAFVDPLSGEVTAHSTGPDGNLGCPWTDEEIDTFGEILKNSGSKLGESDQRALIASLRANRDRVEAEQKDAAERAKNGH